MLDDVTLDRKRLKSWHPSDIPEGGANGSHARRADASGTAAIDDKVIADGGFTAVACGAADDFAIDRNRIAKRRRNASSQVRTLSTLSGEECEADLTQQTQAADKHEAGIGELTLHVSRLRGGSCKPEVAQDAPT